MVKKYVYFNSTEDIVASEVAKHLEAIGYTPIVSGTGIDLTSAESVGRFLEPYGDDLAGAVLVNPDIMRGTIEDVTDEMWDKARDVFPMAMLNLTQVTGRMLSHNQRGSIIYLNSIHAEKPIGNGLLYTMGCAAVQMLCREAAIVYGSQNVGVYNIMRGIVEGEDNYFTSEYSPIYHNGELRFPKEKLPSAKSLNELCAFLLSGGAYILNGTDLQADEGFRLYFGKPY